MLFRSRDTPYTREPQVAVNAFGYRARGRSDLVGRAARDLPERFLEFAARARSRQFYSGQQRDTEGDTRDRENEMKTVAPQVVAQRRTQQ